MALMKIEHAELMLHSHLQGHILLKAHKSLNEYHPKKVDVSHYCESKLVNRFTAVSSKVLTSLKEVSVHNITGTWGT